MSRQRFVAATSSGPARSAGIAEDGQALTEGNFANIAIFDPAEEWVIDASALQSKSTNTPWHGDRLVGRVRHTVCRGDLVVHQGELVNQN